MRSLILLALIGCTVGGSSRAQVTAEDLTAVRIAVSSIPHSRGMRIVSVADLATALHVIRPTESITLGDLADSLVIADPDSLPRCAVQIRPRCELIGLQSANRRRNVLTLELVSTEHRGCGFSNYTVRVESIPGSARVLGVTLGETGSCGRRGVDSTPDPGTPPRNLTSALVHEIDHLLGNLSNA